MGRRAYPGIQRSAGMVLVESVDVGADHDPYRASDSA